MATKAGRVRGNLETSTRERTEYAIFYGVPYAKPPIGIRRLMAPQPLDPWEGVFDNALLSGNARVAVAARVLAPLVDTCMLGGTVCIDPALGLFRYFDCK